VIAAGVRRLGTIVATDDERHRLIRVAQITTMANPRYDAYND